MTEERFRDLVTGTLDLWQVEARACFEARTRRCRILAGDRTLAVVSHADTALGGAWRIEPAGRSPRTHLSVVPALATLHDALCPGRPRARVLFVAVDDMA